MAGPASSRTAQRYHAGRWETVERAIPEEAPVTITPNGAAFAAVMATPADLEDLAIGFALTEGVVDDVSEIGDVAVRAVDEGFEAALEVPEPRAAALDARRRAFAARTSCSLCGLESLDALLATRPSLSALNPSSGAVPAERILAAMAALPARQALNAQTHAVHAAGLADAGGDLALVREDVGRHNALDKLIGARLRQGAIGPGAVVCLTSRCSIEMVLKAARAGVSVLAAASSPTELAVRAADASGIALVACVKGGALEVYAGAGLLERAA